MRRVAVAAAFVMLVATGAAAQAIVHPNQIQFEIAFSNTNPVILDELSRSLLPPQGFSYNVSATSSDMVPSLTHATSVPGPSRVGASGEITVESSPTGIAYDVACEVRGPGTFYYTTCVRSAPVRPEPEPDPTVRISECVGMVRVRFVDGDGNPFPVDGASMTAMPVAAQPCISLWQATANTGQGATEVILLVRGDESYLIGTQLKLGTDPFHDQLAYEDRRTMRVDCDQIVDVNIACGPGVGGGAGGGGGEGGAFELGGIIGIADVLGADENPEDVGSRYYDRTSVWAEYGPWGNSRWDRLWSTPASGAFELENMMPSDVTIVDSPYTLQANFSLGSGERLQNLTQQSSVSVPNGATVDVGDMFEIDPGRVRGDILLAGPPALGPPLVPALGLMRRMGPAPLGCITLNDACHAEALMQGFGRTPLASHSVGLVPSASAGFPGDFDPVGGAFAGDYDLLVGGLSRGPSTCDVGLLKLLLRSEPEVPAFENIDTYVALEDLDGRSIGIAPGEVVDAPMHACFSQVLVSFLSTSAPFTNPLLRSCTGSDGCEWRGVDFEGRPTHRNVFLEAKGTPHAGGAAPDGLVVTTLPEGDYQLYPEVTTVNPGGGTSLTRMLPIDLHVGCREVVSIFPDFLMDAASLPPCTQPGVMTIDGQVRGGAEVARITWQVNADPPQSWCAPCGVDPTFAIPVAVGGGDVSVVVTAETADGRSTSRRSFSREAVEPSALDLRPASTPLRLRRAGAGLELTWEDDGAHGVNAYRGTLASLHDARAYDHAGFDACDIAGGRLTTSPPAGSFYFLVGTSCGWGDSSLGRDSLGRERPAALYRCP